MNILIIAGEHSGDMYASCLAKAFKHHLPSLHLTGIGGIKLKKNVDTFIFESAYQHGVRLTHALKKSSFKKNLLSTLTTYLSSHSIHKAIIIDFQHYNHDIATLLKKHNILIDTFITPNFWMWQSKRKAKQLCHYSQHIYTIFEKEYEFYKALKKEVFYYGHPLTDKAFNKTLKMKNTDQQHPIKTITFFPGSRQQEFDLYLTPMLKSIPLIAAHYPNCHYIISVSAPAYKQHIINQLNIHKPPNTSLNDTSGNELYQNSDIVITAAGSTTLEAILTKTPIVVCAALPKTTYLVAKYILRLKLNYISLPNFIANTDIIPELVQSQITAENITKKVQFLNKNKLTILENYKKVTNKLIKQPDIFNRIVNQSLQNIKAKSEL